MKLFHILNIKSVYKTKNMRKRGQLPRTASLSPRSKSTCLVWTLMSHPEQEEEDEEGRQKNEELLS
jgi:hypothetical protein